MELLTLREVCEKYSVSRRAVQGYEKAGLVVPSGKTDRGYLLYNREAQSTICEIKRLQNYGFKISEISEFMKLVQNDKIIRLKEKHRILKETESALSEMLLDIEEKIRELSNN